MHKNTDSFDPISVVWSLSEDFTLRGEVVII